MDAGLGEHTELEQALGFGQMLECTPVPLSADDLLFLQYTGGTTGLSKGAMLSHGNLLANLAQYRAMMPSVLRPGEEVLVTAIPLYHIFALMVSLVYMTAGAANWLVANPRDMDALIALLKVAKPSVFIGVNTLYASLLAQPELAAVDFTQLRLSIGGGAAIQTAVSERWEALTGNFIREGYGLSETSP
ncbi:MAG: AMP-binding protein, partial [Roseateles sp.]